MTFAHPRPIASLSHVRAKTFGRRLDDAALAIVRDMVAGEYSDIHLASFITACAGGGSTAARPSR